MQQSLNQFSNSSIKFHRVPSSTRPINLYHINMFQSAVFAEVSILALIFREVWFWEDLPTLSAVERDAQHGWRCDLGSGH